MRQVVKGEKEVQPIYIWRQSHFPYVDKRRLRDASADPKAQKQSADLWDDRNFSAPFGLAVHRFSPTVTSYA